jgi:superfamily I DNA/RNA helicase
VASHDWDAHCSGRYQGGAYKIDVFAVERSGMQGGGLNGNDQMAQARSAATAAIVDSRADKKLVVAGPGTGKTHTFKQALRAVEGKGLALTFIRNLVSDLEETLGDLADVSTFHGFCKRQMHLNSTEGLVGQLDYYPPFLELVVHDLRLHGRPDVEEKELERALHNLDDSDGLISDTLRVGDYYKAVSHTDVVYRMLRFFEANEHRIPVYPLIVVDEYQDFSLLETSFIALLAAKSPVLIAGDDDQALYGFKNASARYVRELFADATYEKFELPYCSRCTEVVVAAVNDAIAAATANGNLLDRIVKQFHCYLPDRQLDSDAHSRIVHARCTVERNNAPYVGRYITRQISQITPEDIRESHDNGYPTVLVIGPNPFLKRAFEMIHESYPQAVLKTSHQPAIEPLDGYRRLAHDERSRLGWRIIIGCDLFDGADALLTEVLPKEAELADALPNEYRNCHLEIAALVRVLLDGEQLGGDQEARICAAVHKTIEEVRETLRLPEDVEEGHKDKEVWTEAIGEVAAQEGVTEDEPTIICTSLVGAKGLSGGYVYIVGCNDTHLPRDPSAITDEEVCCFLVALSRTRKECQLVSCDRFGNAPLNTSRFLSWIHEHVDQVTVNAGWFNAN